MFNRSTSALLPITFWGLAKWLLCVGLCVGKPFCQARVSGWRIINDKYNYMEEKIEKILLDLNIGYITVRVAKTKILKLIENEKQKPKP